MKTDPIRGKTIRWTFSDGQMKGKSFDHTFDENGSVSWTMPGGKKGRAAKYESAPVGEGVHAVSYRVDGGYTLTVVLDFRTHQLVAFASNDKELSLQHGTFEPDIKTREEGAVHA
jgi:hypothetical protein